MVRGEVNMNEIYVNGNIYTVTKGTVEAFVVNGNKFIYVGNNDDALKYKESDSRVIDLGNKFVTAGFNDSHMHLISTGLVTNMAVLDNAKSMDELILIGKNFIKEKSYNKDKWVMGFGWNQDYFDKPVFPNRYDLDKISTDHAICFMRICYHSYVVNSKALEIAGITKETPQVEGGHFDIDENGEPTGVFREAAIELITSKIPSPGIDEIKETILLAVKNCNSVGITSVQSDDLCEFADVSYSEIIRAFKELEAESNLNIRVYQQSRFDNISSFKDFIEDGYRTGVGNHMFKIGPLKLLGDGSLGARTALLNEPYSDDKNTCGIGNLNQYQLNEWIMYAVENKMQIAIHAIGDKMMYMVLNAYEKALTRYPSEDHRNGIIHAQITDKYILQKMKAMDLLAYVQTIFIDYDSSIIESRIGKERLSDTYNFKTMLDLGIRVSNSSDSPVEWTTAVRGIQSAVTRRSFAEGSKPFLKNQAMTVEEAIYSYTQAGAYASFEESFKGSIEVNKVADFIVLDNDLLNIDKNRIKDVNVISTYIDGKLVWSR